MKKITSFANENNVIFKSSITATLRNKALQELTTKYNITEISDSDFETITNNAEYLVHSYQVIELSDITLDSIYECFNDISIKLN